MYYRRLSQFKSLDHYHSQSFLNDNITLGYNQYMPQRTLGLHYNNLISNKRRISPETFWVLARLVSGIRFILNSVREIYGFYIFNCHRRCNSYLDSLTAKFAGQPSFIRPNRRKSKNIIFTITLYKNISIANVSHHSPPFALLAFLVD